MERIALHSVPRSGSSWLGEIINSSPSVKYCFQPLFSYALKDFLNERSGKEEIDEFFARLAVTDDDFILQAAQRASGHLPAFGKEAPTHVAYKEVRYHHLLPRIAEHDPSVRMVLLVRDPLEAMASWVSAPREFDPAWSVDEELLFAPRKNAGRPEEFYGLSKWLEATGLFLRLAKEHEDRVLLVRYRDLERDTVSVARNIFAFCGLEFTSQTSDFIDASKTKSVEGAYSVFRGDPKPNSWEKVLSEDNIELIRNAVMDSGLGEYLN